MISSFSWFYFYSVSENLHEHLIYCYYCHARNSQVSHSAFISHFIQKKVVKISDFFSFKTFFSIIIQIAFQFFNYNYMQTEKHWKSHQFFAFKQDEKCQILFTTYYVIITFFLLQYKISNDEDLTDIIDDKNFCMFSQIFCFLITNKK